MCAQQAKIKESRTCDNISVQDAHIKPYTKLNNKRDTQERIQGQKAVGMCTKELSKW